MNEELYNPGLDPYRRGNLIKAAQEIADAAIEQVASKYGTGDLGDTHEPGTEADLPYHNVEHTLRVQKNALFAAKVIGLEKYDQTIVSIAAAAHDIVHGRKRRGENESQSIRWLERAMQHRDFPRKHIRFGKLAIDGTRVITDDNGWMYAQKAERMPRYPYGRKEWISLCVAMADMADLFSPQGPLLCHALYQEYQGVPYGEVPSMKQLIAFQAMEVQFLKTFQFAHPIGEELFARLRPQVIAHHERLLEKLESGVIGDWESVLAFDQVFADTYYTKGVSY